METEIGSKIVNEMCNIPEEGSLLDLFPVLDLKEDKIHEFRKNVGVEIKLQKIENNHHNGNRRGGRKPNNNNNRARKRSDAGAYVRADKKNEENRGEEG